VSAPFGNIAPTSVRRLDRQINFLLQIRNFTGAFAFGLHGRGASEGRGRLPVTTDTSDNLELVMLEMRMHSIDIIRDGFSDSLARVAGELEARLLFNVRLDDGEANQRCAAILLGQGRADACVALVFLDSHGHSVQIEDSRASSHPLAQRAIQAVDELPSR
jgi:hypothetical protein